MQRRWWLLGALLVIGIAAGFGIGSAVKSTSAPARSGSLASSAAGTDAQATVTRPKASVPVPPLRAKATASHTTTSTSSATSNAAVTTTATTVTHTATTPPPSIPTTASHTTTVQSTTTGAGGGGGGGS
jgi:hypothetical protein